MALQRHLIATILMNGATLPDGSTQLARSTQNIQCWRSDDQIIDFQMLDEIEQVVPLVSPGNVFFAIMDRKYLQAPLYTFQATMTDAPNGIGYFTIPQTCLAALAAQQFAWDVVLVDQVGNRSHLTGLGGFLLSASANAIGAPVTPPAPGAPLGMGPSGTAAEVVTGAGVIPAGALLKATTTAGRYALWLKTDSITLMLGCAATACSGTGASFTAQFVIGPLVSLLSDGAATIAAGAPLTGSLLADGRVKTGIVGTDTIIGFNVGTPVAATVDALVSARLRR